MDKGIRPYCNAKFAELLPQRNEMGNTAFRKTVMSDIMEQFGITLASAATHYNHSFQTCKKANPELVAGLGRADDKKGGRKSKKVAPATTEVLALDFTDSTAVVPPVAEVAEVVEIATDEKLYNVTKVKDGQLVLLGVTLAVAQEAVAKAEKSKKAKLQIV